jgi:hypothetical protein
MESFVPKKFKSKSKARLPGYKGVWVDKQPPHTHTRHLSFALTLPSLSLSLSLSLFLPFILISFQLRKRSSVKIECHPLHNAASIYSVRLFPYFAIKFRSRQSFYSKSCITIREFWCSSKFFVRKSALKPLILILCQKCKFTHVYSIKWLITDTTLISWFVLPDVAHWMSVVWAWQHQQGWFVDKSSTKKKELLGAVFL